MKKRKKNVIYCIAYMVLWVVFRIVMPTRCINKQNRPEGGALLCANHSRLATSKWLVRFKIVTLDGQVLNPAGPGRGGPHPYSGRSWRK